MVLNINKSKQKPSKIYDAHRTAEQSEQMRVLFPRFVLRSKSIVSTIFTDPIELKCFVTDFKTVLNEFH